MASENLLLKSEIMSGEYAQAVVNVPVHTKGVQWGHVQGSMGQGPHMGVIVGYAQTFIHMVYLCILHILYVWE